MHGMRHHGPNAAHKLQLLLMMMRLLRLRLMLLKLLLMELQRVRVLHVWQLLGATKWIMPRTLGRITLKRFVLDGAARDASRTAASQRCALHVACLGAEASQYTRTESGRILESVACVAWLAIPHIARLLQYDMTIVRCAIVHLQHGGECVRPDQINDRDEHASNEAEYAW